MAKIESADRLPTALTVIKFIAAGDGTLKGHPCYLTRRQITKLCKHWLAERPKSK